MLEHLVSCTQATSNVDTLSLGFRVHQRAVLPRLTGTTSLFLELLQRVCLQHWALWEAVCYPDFLYS